MTFSIKIIDVYGTFWSQNDLVSYCNRNAELKIVFRDLDLLSINVDI